VTDYLDLADYLLIAEAVTGVPAKTLARLPRLDPRGLGVARAAGRVRRSRVLPGLRDEGCRLVFPSAAQLPTTRRQQARRLGLATGVHPTCSAWSGSVRTSGVFDPDQIAGAAVDLGVGVLVGPCRLLHRRSRSVGSTRWTCRIDRPSPQRTEPGRALVEATTYGDRLGATQATAAQRQWMRGQP
jgi:hypothetical protein